MFVYYYVCINSSKLTGKQKVQKRSTLNTRLHKYTYIHTYIQTTNYTCIATMNKYKYNKQIATTKQQTIIIYQYNYIQPSS